MQEHQFKAVIFDGGGVFSMTADAGGDRYWERKLGLGEGGLRSLITPEINRQANLGLISEEQAWELALRALGLDAATRLAIGMDFWAGAYLDYDMAALIERVHAKGIRTALLSNAWIGARLSHTALGWDRLLKFDVQMFSAEEGMKKPDPAFYNLCLDRLRVSASKTLFIDDTLVNVEAARQLGIPSIHYTNKQRDMAEIERLLGI
jgi:epoxide hydrolase-like predicted phosphatase